MKNGYKHSILARILQVLLLCLWVISVVGFVNTVALADHDAAIHLNTHHQTAGASPSSEGLAMTAVNRSGGHWLKTYSTNGNDEFRVIQETADGGFIVAGDTSVLGTGRDVLILKLQADGTVVWQNTYGGGNDDEASAVQQTADGGFIVTGTTASFGANNAWVLKLNSNGTVAWQKAFGNAEADFVNDIEETSDGGFILIGHMEWPDGPPPNPNIYNAWMVKLNTNGSIAWQKEFDHSFDDRFTIIRETSNGDFIVGGFTSLPDFRNQAWALKVTSNGTVTWQKLYEIGYLSIINSIQETSDGGFIAAGSVDVGSFSTSADYDGLVIKLNSDGTMAWQKNYDWGNGDSIAEIQETPTGDFIVAGTIGNSDDTGSVDDAWIAKLDATGAIVWQKSYDVDPIDRAASVQVTSDGDFIVAGFSDTNAWAMKLDANGNIGGCSALGSGTVAVNTEAVTTQDTAAAVQNATLGFIDTFASPLATSATVNAVCQTLTYYSISGQVKDTSDNPVPDIAIATNRGHRALTDATGHYTLTLLAPSFYIVTPEPSNVVFNPVEHFVSITNTNVINQDFVMTPPATLDLEAFGLEVTQAIQDLNNSVTLIEGKPTYVRVYARSNEPGNYRTTARLRVEKGGNVVFLDPINADNGHVGVQEYPLRAVIDDGFLFELPTHLTFGTISLVVEVNPAAGGHNPVEVDYNNNFYGPVTVSFETIDPMDIVFYHMGYRYWDGISIQRQVPTTRTVELTDTVDLMYRMYPFNDIVVHPYRTADNIFLIPDENNCFTVNLALMYVKNMDYKYGVKPIGTRYYAIADDNSENLFDGACAWFIPFGSFGGVGSGETKIKHFAKLHVHEFGHMFARTHPPAGCGESEPIDRAYPYPNGRISPTIYSSLPEAIFGFDVAAQQTYWPLARDNMSYCDREKSWISDYTYEGIKLYHDIFPPFASNSMATDRLSVMGLIDPVTLEVVQLQPLYVIPNAEDIEPQTPGDYTIVLRDDQGGELARYPFTPDVAHDQTGAEMFLITEWVPYVTGTTQVDIEGPTGVMTSVTAGAGTPNVTLTSPNGGEILSGNTITLTWSASDPDNDPLTYMVQYSADNGASWQVVATDIADTQLVLAAANAPASTEGLFRVWVSDGIHTHTDESDNPFTIVNRNPTATIVEPAQAVTIAISQTLSLKAEAYDIDSGMLDGNSLTWSSSIDGHMGHGRYLSFVGLSIGTHSITLTADDGDGGLATDSVQVTVVDSIYELPPVPDRLVVSPNSIDLTPHIGIITASLSIDNQSVANPVAWNATTDIQWIQLSASSGTTPEDIQVTYLETGLDEGFYTGTITFTSPISPAAAFTVDVDLTVERSDVIFSDGIEATTTAWDIKEITAVVPAGVIDGDVIVETSDGVSNGSPFFVGSSFTPNGDGQGTSAGNTFSGVINADTIWSENIWLVGDVTVAAGATLTIEPGVTVFLANSDQMAAGYWTDKTEIHVFGRLIAEGTEESPIYFTSEAEISGDAEVPAPSAGDWGAIVFRRNSTGSSLSYCMVQYAKQGIRLSANKEGGGAIAATVSNCTITNNEMGVYMYGNPGYPAGGTITINAALRHNYIHTNLDYGVRIQTSSGYGTSQNMSLIQNNRIEDNGVGIFLRANSWWAGHVDNYPAISNNTITQNSGYGIHVQSAGSGDNSGSDTDAQPVIENNLLENNYGGNIYLQLQPNGSDGVQILNPVIRYNTLRNLVRFWVDGILIEDTQSYGTLQPTISHNVFYGFSGYVISNLTNRSITAQENYWGDSETAWDAGPQPGNTNGMVDTTNFLTTASAPIITRLDPAASQFGDEIVVHGANLGQLFP
ncbi:MAG: right-handed parallel beta-helix repeat-containing protein [Ardenticatenaceae bacterium]|nr:right-handed parallel beta-helix repeat-containing protein [Ardenticatenaceae bacterium]